MLLKSTRHSSTRAGLLSVCLLWFGGAPVVGQCDHPMFLSAPRYAVCEEPSAIALGDLNGDGWLDMAVTNEDIDSLGVYILLNNGDGTFVCDDTLAVGEVIYLTSVALADLDGDDWPDVVVSAHSYIPDYWGKVFTFLNNGDGTFGAPVEYSAGAKSRFVALADLNGDEWIDIAVANEGDWYYGLSADVSVLLNNGDGTFAPDVRYETGNNPSALALADLNGDDRIDMAVTSAEGGWYLSVLFNDGDGTFAEPVGYDIPCRAMGRLRIMIRSRWAAPASSPWPT
jgi:hypothetical protein